MTISLVDPGQQRSPLDPAQQTYEEQQRNEALLSYEDSRLYYSGEQYETDNEAVAVQTGYSDRGRRLPEHLRRHAYSSHIGEAVDVLADMLAEGIAFDGEHADVLNEFFMQAELEDRMDDWFREALVTGNSFAQPIYDPVTESMQVNFWESESVWPVYDQDDWRSLDHWYRYRTFVEEGVVKTEKRIIVAEPFIVSEGVPIFQVVEYVYIDEEFQRVEESRLPFFDLVHGRGDSRSRLRSMFGDSLITKKVRGTADRYNAVAQLGFRITRQNSFATVAVVGDAAFLGQGRRDEAIAKDVADVLSFPGGTSVETITLPTDPRTMEWQISVLEKNIYREFGLTKTDMEDMTGMGTVSGYALEVMNRKERATHKRIRKNAVAGIRELANMMLDIAAVRQGEADGMPWWKVDPLEVYPNREGIKVTIGSGDIVDAVSDREDFSVGLVSRKYILGRRGLTQPEIDDVEKEVQAEREALAKIQTDSTLAVNAQTQEYDLERQRIAADQAVRQAQLSTQSGTQTGTTQGG